MNTPETRPGQPATVSPATVSPATVSPAAVSPATGSPAIASRSEQRTARLVLLAREKELTRLRDELAAQRRRLPWVRLEKQYEFDGPDGRVSLPKLFDGRGQLIVYHFMLGPGWGEGCPICSFWADSYEGLAVHLAHRDTSLVVVSRAPYAEVDAYRRRMGWSFPWLSSAPGDFNNDFGVSFTAEQRRYGAEYNYRHESDLNDELAGLSVFASGEDGQVYHTYSAYSRGLDALNGAYQLLDLTPKGRDEQDLPWSMAWVRRHDSY
jgi:predicted dithiol-disulfide oxidoreductase (DUF899 family)